MIRPPTGRKIAFEDAEPAESVEEKDLERVVVEFRILLMKTDNVKEKMDAKLFFILDWIQRNVDKKARFLQTIRAFRASQSARRCLHSS